MNITIEKTRNDGDKTYVEFSSKYGRSSAVWVAEEPSLGTSYDVEFEIDDDLVWGETISTTTRDASTIDFTGGLCVIVGRVISLEKDGCLAIALGDNVILLDVEQVPKDVSGLVECHASQVKLYPTNL